MKSIFLIFIFTTFGYSSILSGQNIDSLFIKQKIRLNNATYQSNIKTIDSIKADLERILFIKKNDNNVKYYLALTLCNRAFLNFHDKGLQNKNYIEASSNYLKQIIENNNLNQEAHILFAYINMFKYSLHTYKEYASIRKNISKSLQIAKEIDSLNPRYLFVKGMDLFHKPFLYGGNKNKAKKMFQKSIYQFSKQTCNYRSNIPCWGEVSVNRWLGNYFAYKKNYEKAIECFDIAIAISHPYKDKRSYWMKKNAMKKLNN